MTSWIALRELGCLMVRHGLVDQPLEDAGDHERAREGDPRQDLGALERARLRAAAPAGGVYAPTPAAAAAAGSVSEPRPGDITFAPERSRRAGCGGGGLAAQALGGGGLLARPRGLGLGLLGALSRALRSLRESFSSCFSASSTSSWAFAVSSSARRASVSRSSARSSAPRASAVRALGLRVRLARRGGLARPRRRSSRRRPRRSARARRVRRGSSSAARPTPAVRWGSSSLTRADLPQRCGGKPRRQCGWSRSRPGHRCRPAGRTRPGA